MKKLFIMLLSFVTFFSITHITCSDPLLALWLASRLQPQTPKTSGDVDNSEGAEIDQANQQVQASSELARQALRLAKMLPVRSVVGKTSGIVTPVEIQRLLNAQPDRLGVIRVPVLQQGQTIWPKGVVVGTDSQVMWENVKTDDGANCAYHALKNVILLMNALQNNNKQALQGLTSGPMFVDFMRVWVPIIWQKYSRYYKGGSPQVNWLEGKHVDYLKNNLSDTILNFRTYKDKIKIFEYIKDQEHLNSLIYQELFNFAQQSDGILGVLWNESRGDHWVAFVVYRKQGISKVYYMNSTGGKTYGTYGLDIALRLLVMSAKQLQEKLDAAVAWQLSING